MSIVIVQVEAKERDSVGILKRGYLVECDECGEEYIMADSECSEFCDCLSPEDTGNVCMSCYLSLLSLEIDEHLKDYWWHTSRAAECISEVDEINDILWQFI